MRLLGSLPITPGGIGIVELGLTGALVGFGGANDAVVAAVLLYRVITIVPTLVLGLVAGALWRRLRPELHAEAVAAAQAAAVEPGAQRHLAHCDASAERDSALRSTALSRWGFPRPARA